MKYWYFINYKIYEFYDQRKDSTPAAASAGVSSVLVQLNFITVHYFVYTFLGINLIYHIPVIIIIYAALLLFNYITIYRDKKYEKIFKEMEDWDFRDQQPSKLFYLYFFSTIFTFLGVMIASLANG